MKWVRRFSIVLDRSWCFVCLHVQESQGRTSPSNTTVCVIFVVGVPYISYMERKGMAGVMGSRQTDVSIVLRSLHFVDYDAPLLLRWRA